MATMNVNHARARSDVLARVEEDGVEFVRFWFTDILGQLKSFAVGREEMEEAFEDGMGFDGSSITGFNAIEESDMIAMPDPEHLQAAAVAHPRDHKVGALFCDVLRPGRRALRGRPALRDARALQRAKEHGFDAVLHRPGARVLHCSRTTRAPRCSTRAGTSTSPRSTPARTSAATRSFTLGSSGSGWSTPTTRSARPSTRSTCATRAGSRCPTTR